MVFGKANRASKDYAGLITKYKTKLQAGGKASGRFVPDHVAAAAVGCARGVVPLASFEKAESPAELVAQTR